jgi:hypothetical protein
VPVTTSGVDYQRDDVPEADWAEQGVDAEEVRKAGTRLAGTAGSVSSEVDEADLAEQQTLAYGAEDDDRV